MTESPWLWLIAGPNGAGKSTYAEVFFSDVEEIVRPDELATGLLASAPEKVAVKAGRLALIRISALLEQRRSFAVETTLSGHFQPNLVRRARAAGWKVGIVYIGLRDPDLAVQRVLFRHLRGGHNVPPADVRRRYYRSLKNLADVCRIASEVVVLDNSCSSSAPEPLDNFSSAPEPMERILEMHEGRIVFTLQNPPKWLRRSLGSLLKK